MGRRMVDCAQTERSRRRVAAPYEVTSTPAFQIATADLVVKKLFFFPFLPRCPVVFVRTMNVKR